MKFDVIVMNSPYNPNSLWKKFTLKAIELLKDDGQMVSIHPDSWRISSTHDKLCQHLKEHISELHITDFNSFPGVGISTDWYLYNKQNKNKCKVIYANNESEILTFDDSKIFSFPTTSIPSKIISKICTKKDNNIIIKNTGFGIIYNNYITNGQYKQCGGKNRGTSWTENDYHLTNEPTEHQFDNKVVMCYTRRPRAKFISKEDEIGVLRANYWLTNNQELPILLNSKMIWKLGIQITAQDPNNKTKGVWGFPNWFLKSLNFEGLTATTEEELYEHYNLTQEEINFCES